MPTLAAMRLRRWQGRGGSERLTGELPRAHCVEVASLPYFSDTGDHEGRGLPYVQPSGKARTGIGRCSLYLRHFKGVYKLEQRPSEGK